MSASVAGLLLAAGASTRTGQTNKLLFTKSGTSMLSHSARVLRDSGVATLLAVAGSDHSHYREQLEALGFTLQYNPDHSQGLGTSLRVGLSCLQDTQAVMVCLADMPHLHVSTLTAMINCWQSSDKRQFVVPVVDGRRGNPVIIPACLYSNFSQSNNDVGASIYMKNNPDSVLNCPVSDPNILIDFDTKADLLAAGWKPPYGLSE